MLIFHRGAKIKIFITLVVLLCAGAAIIQLGREIFQQHRVSSETFARALQQLGEKNLIDLCDLMGSYTTTAILLHTVDLHLPYDRKPLLPLPEPAAP